MKNSIGQNEAKNETNATESKLNPNSDLPSRFNIVACCALSFFMFGLTSSIIGPTIVDLSAAVGISIAAAGLLRSGRQVGQFIGFLIFGKAADQYDLRWLALFGGIFMGLGLLLVFQGGIVIAISACLIWGLGHSTFNLAPNVIIGRVFKERGPAIMTSLHGVYGVGAIAGPWFVEIFRAEGVETIYAMTGIMSGLAGLIYWAFTRKFAENLPPEKDKELKQNSTINLRVFVPFALAVLLFSGANFTASDWLHYYTNEVIGAGNFWATIVTSAFWVAMTGGRFALGFAVSQWGEKLILRASTVSAILGSMILALPFVSTMSITVGAALLGFGLAPIYPILIVSAANLFPESRGRTTGMLAAAGAFGAVVLPVLQGWLMSSQDQGLVVVLFSTIALGIVIWIISSKN